ncbi:MAG: polysaccharide biosynthesis protein [Bdellovibrionota bacterium]
MATVKKYFDDKTVLVTGGTGSMGKTFVRRILSKEQGMPKKVIVFSRDEGKQHQMRQNYQNKLVSTDEVIYENFRKLIEFRIGDVRNYADVVSAVRGVDVVVNAAALKQVPTCEYFPEQAIATNCMGAHNIVRAIREHNFPVDTVVGISTDKACKPINVMGMTKAIMERIFISANILNPQTRFIGVRYGNVMASRGSVIPVFHDQIKSGGPVTVTMPEMTRFLLTLDDAVDTVFHAVNHAKAGDLFVPDAPSATVINLAKALVGDRKIEIVETGIRPGEKIHEIMISEEETYRARRVGNYYSIVSMLPELSHDSGEKVKFTKEYSSEDKVVDLEATRKILATHNLLMQ